MPRQISPRELATYLATKQPTVLLDVRQPWEHAMSAIAGSMLIPLHELAARVREITPGQESLVVCYCHHGIRSLSAVAILERSGVPNVASLAGGIDAWACEVDPSVTRY